MAKYCQEKFERRTDGKEQVVYWRQDKHIHDATIITAIERWLGQKLGGEWSVRGGSFISNLSSPPVNGIEFS